jgi:nitrate reductase gamma subunit
MPSYLAGDNMIGTILFYAGFLLLLLLFTEEFARTAAWLRTQLAQYPRYRLIAYPLIAVLLLAAGIVIATSLIEFATTTPFSYE